jgi:ribosome biogenesis protein BMS1
VCCFCLVLSTRAGFRISLTGTALEQRATPQVVKKLKLVGTPTKIYKNSAFITGTSLVHFCSVALNTPE